MNVPHGTNPTPIDPGSITLKVKGQDGRQLFFKIRRSSQMKKLLTIYCEKRFLPYRTVRFLLNGKRFNAARTPDQLGLQDGDEIEAMEHMQGGGSWFV